METVMSKRFALLATAAALAFAVAAPAPVVYAQMAEKTVTVGGAPMYPSKNIIQNAVNSKDHTNAGRRGEGCRLGRYAVRPRAVHGVCADQRGLRQTAGRHRRHPAQAENKATLTKVLTYHVVPGRMTAVNLMKAVKDGEGEAISRPSPAWTWS